MENYVIKDTEFLNELVNSSLKYTDISVYAAGIYNKSHSIEISICSHYAIITCTSKDSIVNLLIVKESLDDTRAIKLGKLKFNTTPKVLTRTGEADSVTLTRKRRAALLYDGRELHIGEYQCHYDIIATKNIDQILFVGDYTYLTDKNWNLGDTTLITLNDVTQPFALIFGIYSELTESQIREIVFNKLSIPTIIECEGTLTTADTFIEDRIMEYNSRVR